MAVVHIVAITIAAIVVIVAVLFVAPAYPTSYDVAVTVNMSEVQAIIASYYSVNSVSGATAGQSRFIDINALGIVWGSVSASDSLQVCVGGHCKTLSESKLFPTLPTNTNLNVQTTVTVGYVPPGPQMITATLTVNGANEGSSSGTVCAGC
jgi:hypothetical protein